MTGAIGFDRDLQQLPNLAEFRGREDEVGGVEMVLQMTGIEPEATLIGAARADKAVLRQSRRRDSRRCRPAGMEAFVPGAVFQKFQAARRCRERDSLRHDQLLFGQPHQPARGKHARESADETGRMKAHLVEGAFGHGAEPRRGLDAENIGREHLASACPAPRADRQHGRGQARSGVNNAAGVGIVEIEPVDEDAVHERRVAHRQPRRHADHRGIPGSGKRGDRRHRSTGEIVGGRGERNPHRVEDEMLGARDHGDRNGVGRKSADETREILGNQRTSRGGLRSSRLEGHGPGGSLRAHPASPSMLSARSVFDRLLLRP